jgi:hypothetical protein
MSSKLVHAIRARCQQQGWYGPDAFKGKRSAEPGKSRFLNGFAFPAVTKQQIQTTEELLGYPLPSSLCSLYQELAKGGFGPGFGLRGAVGGYGTIGTLLPNEYCWLGDETLVKDHLGEHLVDLTQLTDEWQDQGNCRVLRLSSNVWPRQLFPICDLGDDVEVCLDLEGHLYRYASSAQKGIYTFSDSGTTFEQWIRAWLES